MALQRLLSPALVLCGSCREDEDNADRIAPFANKDDCSVLVRDVCAAIDCPELQVRGHLCQDHMLQFELAWQNRIPVRACHGCRKSVLQLYADKQEVWCILAWNDQVMSFRGVEQRHVDKSILATEVVANFSSPVRVTGKGKGRARTSSTRKRVRKSARTLRQLSEHERMRALEWSLGNIQVKQLFLWKDNKRRFESENTVSSPGEGIVATSLDTVKLLPQKELGLPEPLTVFCAVHGCGIFAKKGDRCLFHASTSLSSYRYTGAIKQ